MRTYTYDEGSEPLTVRLQTLNGAEVMDVFSAPEEHRKLLTLSYAIVDENGDCIHTHDIESVAYLPEELEGGEFMWLIVTAEQHCFGGGAVGEDSPSVASQLSDLRERLGDLTQIVSSMKSQPKT